MQIRSNSKILTQKSFTSEANSHTGCLIEMADSSNGFIGGSGNPIWAFSIDSNENIKTSPITAGISSH